MADEHPKKRGSDARKASDPQKPSNVLLIKAVNHPIRRQILRSFEDGEARSARDITKVVLAPLATISYHLGVLKKIGIVTELRTEKKRGALKKICAASMKDADPYVLSILRATEQGDDREVPRASSLNNCSPTEQA